MGLALSLLKGQMNHVFRCNFAWFEIEFVVSGRLIERFLHLFMVVC